MANFSQWSFTGKGLRPLRITSFKLPEGKGLRMPREQPLIPPIRPTCFVPSCAADFVGHAGKVAEVLMRKAERLRATPDQPLKLLISGAPGIGKTSLVNMIARTLANHPVAIEDVNGKEVGLELAREWTRSLAYGSLF